MSINNIKTKGDVESANRIDKMRAEQKERQLQAQAQKLMKRANDIKRGQFKKIVTDSVLETFANNYGASFDYNSLINAISFSEHNDQNHGLQFTFNIKYNDVIFTTDAKKECREFNENSYQDFISNEDSIAGDYLTAEYFDNKDEYLGYELQGELEDEMTAIDDSNFLDGQFIPVSDNKNRYGNFNRINKLAGYTPVNISAEDAAKKASSN